MSNIRLSSLLGNGYQGEPGFTGSQGLNKLPKSGTNKTSSYTLQTSDIGKFVTVSSSGSIIVPSNTFSIGDVISIHNDSNSDITITCSAVTAYISGINTVRTSVQLFSKSICSIIFVDTDVCLLNGLLE